MNDCVSFDSKLSRCAKGTALQKHLETRKCFGLPFCVFDLGIKVKFLFVLFCSAFWW